MALPLHALQALRPYLKGARILSLSYPDTVIPAEVLESEFGIKVTTFTNKNGFHRVDFLLPETKEVFQKLGASFECVDVVSSRGMESIIDLNYEANLGEYDIVLDPGTIEHCFNVGQAIFNACHAVRPGGVIYHINPMNMMNHGFFNFNPTLWHDLYTQNGWEILSLNATMESVSHFHNTRRFLATVEYVVTCLAKRRGSQRMKFPVQAKYLKPMKEAA